MYCLNLNSFTIFPATDKMTKDLFYYLLMSPVSIELKKSTFIHISVILFWNLTWYQQIFVWFYVNCNSINSAISIYMFFLYFYLPNSNIKIFSIFNLPSFSTIQIEKKTDEDGQICENVYYFSSDRTRDARGTFWTMIW